MTRSGRAAPLPPDERRAAILRAVRPVILERGVAVTTRELAAAAGVAEGTLFRAFPDKLALLRAAAHEGMDPAGDLPEIEAIDPASPIEERVRAVLALGLARAVDGMRWMMLLHELARASTDPAEVQAGARGAMREAHAHHETSRSRVRAALIEVLRPDEEHLARSLDETAELLNVILMGVTVQTVDARRRGVEPRTPSLDVLVATFLDGVRLHHPPDPRPTSPDTAPRSPRC